MSTPLIGGEGVPSLCLTRVGNRAYIAAHPKKTKKAVWHRWGGRCGAPTVQGYTIPVCKDNKKTRHDAQNREENDVFEDERYDMSEFLPKFAPVYPRRVSLSLRRCLPLPEAMGGGVRGMAHVSKKREGAWPPVGGRPSGDSHPRTQQEKTRLCIREYQKERGQHPCREAGLSCCVSSWWGCCW